MPKVRFMSVVRSGKAIQCHECGRVSWGMGDIAHLYCGRCNEFADFVKCDTNTQSAQEWLARAGGTRVFPKPTRIQLLMEVMAEPCLDLERLYVEEEEVAAALDYLYDHVDDALHAGHDSQVWPDIEALCEQVDIDRMIPSMTVGVLIITLPIKGKLKSRPALVIRIREKLSTIRTSTQVEQILMGLE